MTVSNCHVGSSLPWIVAYGNWLFKYRDKVFPIVMLCLFAGFRPVLAGGNLTTDLWLDLLGVLIAGSGQALRAAVIGYAYIKRGGVNKRIHAERLVTEGFFAHARNPLYDGNLLILAGLFVIHNNPYVYLLGGAWFLFAYISIVAAEEAFLSQKFGEEYGVYCARVNRWLPDFRGLAETVKDMEFNWRRVVIKDYASGYTWMLTALLLIAWEGLVSAGMAGAAVRLRAVAIAAVLLTAAFLLARFLKKRRILTDA